MKKTYLVVQKKTKKKLENKINKLLENSNIIFVGGVILDEYDNHIQAVLIIKE